MMLTFSKTVRTTQLDTLTKPHSLADKTSTPRHNSTNTKTLINQTNSANLTHGQTNFPRLDTTRQTQRPLLTPSTIFIYSKTVRTPQPVNQLDKLDRSAKHLDDSTKSTNFTEHYVKSAKRPTEQTLLTLLAILLDDLRSFTILFRK